MINQESIPLEKRHYPRIPKKLRFDLHADKSGLRAESVNLSRNGVYCKIDHAIPFMAHVRIFMALPKNETEHEPDNIECDGVVVRVEEHTDSTGCNDGYRIAIFFNEIGEYEQQKLDTYIAAQL